ncbi:MAG: 3-oxoacyl-ACP reductase family protein [Pseudomonadota bacterium]|jgi:3-oxoacyl-[acyl-carrier protein] reductase|nr:3-oxoacyl-ACP reductase family protein [Pseudomonadota bacterium]|tara:strand:- start:396 stop:1136 length:741 start_codon:yes stop_codon:yes gene_type:complete
MEHSGKTAFITGGGKNIGRAIAINLASTGCNIVLNGNSDTGACEETAQVLIEKGVKASIVMGNVGSADEVKRMASEALDQFGRIDILVNNAAIRPSKPFLEMEDHDWHRVLDIDLNSAFYTCRAFAGGMIEKGWGRIINITGMNAIHGYKGRAPVSAAKHGLWGLTKSLGKEFGPQGVTTNAISPGPIDTAGDAAQREHILSMVPKVPLGRLGLPEEIAALTGFLCSNGGAFVNGQMINCNGGAET